MLEEKNFIYQLGSIWITFCKGQTRNPETYQMDDKCKNYKKNRRVV